MQKNILCSYVDIYDGKRYILCSDGNFDTFKQNMSAKITVIYTENVDQQRKM